MLVCPGVSESGVWLLDSMAVPTCTIGPMSRSIFISVAEASADQHAAEFIKQLKSRCPQITVRGIGGPKMLAAGALLAHETVGKAAMGWRGALRALEVSRMLRETRRSYERDKPDLHVCVDSSAMNLPFAKMARSMGVPVLYYIAPQLWASREGRMRKMRAYVNKLACILPFEESYFREHGVDATFVGHPLFDELPADRSRPVGPGFPEVPPVIGIVPGSRLGEVKANLSSLLDVACRIVAVFPAALFLIPTTSAVDQMVRAGLAECGPLADKVEIAANGFDALIPRCDLVLCKSGTSTLHVAAWGVPMIVVYRIHPVIWHGAGRWLVKTKKIALVNILAGNIDLVPEFVPWYGSNEPVADCALRLLQNPELLAEQRSALDGLIGTLDRPGASANVARIAMEMIAAGGESAQKNSGGTNAAGVARSE
jgi:lipid-A-disaccharide synthase